MVGAGRLVAILFLLGITPVWAQDEKVSVRFREWFARMEGDVQSEKDGIEGTEDIELDTALDVDRGRGHEVRISLNAGSAGRLSFDAWWATFEGDGTPPRNLVYAGKSFSAGSPIHTEIEIAVYTMLYELPILTDASGKDQLGLLTGFRVYTVFESLEGPGASADERGMLEAPLIGLHAGMSPFSGFRIDAEAIALNIVPWGIELSAGAIEIEMVAEPWKGVSLGIGYKYEWMGFEDEKGHTAVELEAEIRGLYLTAGYSF